MLVLQKKLENVPIMSLQNGTKLGVANRAIIDPRKLQIMAFYAAGARIHQESVLHTGDIREFGPLGFIVNGADSIMELDAHLIRLQEVVNFHFTLLGKMVIDERKHKLGKVLDYAVETDGFTIQKLYVAQSVLKNITSSNLIISRSQIIELNDKFIVVRSGALKEQTGLMQAINPFRRQRSLTPAPESIELKKPAN